jgi:hypothetical protein
MIHRDSKFIEIKKERTMRIKILILGLVCFFLFGCGMPMEKQVKLYPKPADEVYSQLILVLQEMGWTIKNADKASGLILAETRALDKDSFIGSNLINPIQGSFLIKDEDGKACLSLSITQPGESLKNPAPKKLADKILKKLEEKIK